MPVDLAINYNTGDLLIAPNKGIDIRTGQSTVEQRMRVRLRIAAGTWALDPTGGTLGSHLHDVLRIPVWRAVAEVPLMVREALAPMEDIDVRDVVCEINPNDASALDLTISYVMTTDLAGDTMTTSLTIEG